MIDQQIKKHYDEIQRLQQIKGSIETQFSEPQPIIYQQAYPQQIEMSSNGRMVN